jgi:hypothetical protein
MTAPITEWPEPLHNFGCCLKTPFDDPNPRCPGWAVLGELEAA